MATAVEDTNLAQGDTSTIRETVEDKSHFVNNSGVDKSHGDSAIIEKASDVKEHDVIDEEIKQADKIEGEIKNELAENDGWVQILGNDQIMKKVIKEGVANTRPLRGEVCTLKFKGCLKENEFVVFESEENFTFQLGDAEVITGLDLSVPLMCKGEVSTISIAPRFGYGSKGCAPHVPANAWLLYNVELLHFEQEKELEKLPIAERREIGIRKRERGNWWYGRGDAALAVQCYRRALEFLDEAEGGISLPKSEDTIDELKVSDELKLLFDDRLKAYNNMAAAQLKLEAYGPAMKSVETVLKCQPNNVKALFRKGKILGAKGDTDEAFVVLRQAINLEPDNKAVIQELSKLTVKRKEEKENEKLLYKRMFNNSNNEKTASAESKSGFKRSLNIALVAGGLIVAVASVMAYRYVS